MKFFASAILLALAAVALGEDKTMHVKPCGTVDNTEFNAVNYNPFKGWNLCDVKSGKCDCNSDCFLGHFKTKLDVDTNHPGKRCKLHKFSLFYWTHELILTVANADMASRAAAGNCDSCLVTFYDNNDNVIPKGKNVPALWTWINNKFFKDRKGSGAY